jgi:dipeptidyl-peptidase-4
MRHDQGMTTGPAAQGSAAPALDHDDFPRQQAATHRFRLGLPRAFRISPDGSRVVFIRSASGRDAIGSLWALTSTGERLVVDGREVTSGAELPAAEQARRERLRETTSGITTHSTDDSVSAAVFVVDGVPYVIDLVAPGVAARELPHPGPVVDPRMSPDGRHVSYVCNGSLYLVDTGAGEPTLLASSDSDDHSWGLADFVAAEELDRTRGCWWLADSSAILAEFVDESPVTIHWIADPAHPQREPRPHRYPAAGDANPIARLFHITPAGTRTEIDWDRERFPYLATVEPSSGSDAVVSVLSRDQTRQEILLISGSQIRHRRERVTTPWITMQGGVPCAGPSGHVVEIVAFDDAFGLAVDEQRVTPPGVNVDSVLDATAERLLVSATTDPRESHIASVSWTGEFDWITSGPSINAAIAGSGGMVLVHTDATHATTYEARTSTFTASIATHAEQPCVQTSVEFLTVGERALQAALLLPTDHVAGTRLPVIMAPYGGPHAARVRYALGAFSADQWLADQGYAVVIVDGAGTPGRGPSWEFEIEHDLAGVILQDQIDGLHALAARNPDLDLTRVGITGWSFGGYLAALAVLDRPDVFHAGVAGAPVTDWALYDTAYSERYLGTPQDNPEAYRATSLIERAESLTRPLLIIHGLADDNVLASHSLRLSTALLGAGREHGFLPLSGVTHMTPQLSVAENLLRMEVAFLRDALSKPAGSSEN